MSYTLLIDWFKVDVFSSLFPLGKKSLFPDFHTFTSMGFTSEGVVAVDNTLLDSLSVGDPITVIPMFRPEDYMYHNQCDYPENMVCVFVYMYVLVDSSRLLHLR